MIRLWNLQFLEEYFRHRLIIMLSCMNEQVLKWRITIKDSREGGSLDELGSSTDDADNFQREILRG